MTSTRRATNTALIAITTTSVLWSSFDVTGFHSSTQVIDAKTPQAVVKVEGEDIRVDARMIKDDRVKTVKKESILDFDDDDFADRLG
ncbi:hypothetical protein B0H13DRAFT_2318352 [Mycena leptocephala]|nr:hypothetical protein B0H13DRAFT_2318352 [Mycena leptocephala]